ncbi:MAG: polar amino acid transport system substrate-binding protein [Oceanospirillaceae bacterium]
MKNNIFLNVICVYFATFCSTLLFAQAPSTSNGAKEQITQILTPRQTSIPITVIADRDYAPYSYVENDKPQGFYIELFENIFQQLDTYDVTILMLPWKRGLSMLEKGQHFAIFPPYYWPHKRPYIDRYSEAIFVEKVIPICNKEVLERKAILQWPAEFKNLKIGTNRGFLAPGNDFFEMVARNEISLVETINSTVALRMLKLKRIDCYINSKLTIEWTLNKLTAENNDVDFSANFIFSTVISENSAYLGFAAKDNKRFAFREDFARKVDAVIIKMKKDGKINALLQKFITRN